MSPLNWRTGAESGSKLYECTDCLEHHRTDGPLAACPDCGGRVENITKARAE